ncbi:MAG: ABC transporter permease subunit, partial [Anaerolineales bacterium]|nr:ABC transporter permease subunit [Anaerolineales bacterium]
MQREKSLIRSIGFGLTILLGMIVYAYGFNVTKVNFETTRSEKRLTQLSRIMRALAHPALFVYEKEELETTAPIYLPCPKNQVPSYKPNMSEAYLVLTPNCAGPGEIITVEGYNIWPNTKGPINFFTLSGVNLTIGNLHTDANGYFKAKVELPKRKPVDEAQMIRALPRRNIGNPEFSDVAKSTWDKIVETVFLALLATTFGTLLAIPASFFAARNLMSSQNNSLTNIAFSTIGWPLGILIGIQTALTFKSFVTQILVEDVLIRSSIGSVLGIGLAWTIIGWLFPRKQSQSSLSKHKSAQSITIILSVLISILTIYMIANLALVLGQALIEPLGPIGFIGNFISQLGDVLIMVIPAATALLGGGTLGLAGNKLGQYISDHMSPRLIQITNMCATTLAGAVIAAILGNIVDWFYQLDNPQQTLYWPMSIGAILGALVSLRISHKHPIPIGYITYYVTRTILNATRSIEPLVMVIVFVVWVGIGPFAGTLALALHTIAALAKLYSEQVESIAPGPLEAVRATGANRLQTIVYAVIPQIIPPYISFTMYRWDINVRMSTIIGFAGGGGIGFLLQQNINLLDYRAASVQMLAIA